MQRHIKWIETHTEIERHMEVERHTEIDIYI